MDVLDKDGVTVSAAVMLIHFDFRVRSESDAKSVVYSVKVTNKMDIFLYENPHWLRRRENKRCSIVMKDALWESSWCYFKESKSVQTYFTVYGIFDKVYLFLFRN